MKGCEDVNRCSVFVDGKEYDGEYNIENGKIDVDIYDYSDGIADLNNDFITYHSMIIHDYRNKNFFFSSAFHYIGTTYGLTHYESFQSENYLKTSRYETIEEFDCNSKVKSVTFYHPLFIKFFSHPCLTINQSEEKIETILNTKAKAKEVLIQNNNIDCIDFGGRFLYKPENESQHIVIETENYVKLFFIELVEMKDVLAYINEFDVFVNAYAPKGKRSFKTVVEMDGNKHFEFYHKLLGQERYCKKVVRPVVKMDFFDFIEKMYKSVDYRETDNRNMYLPFEFKKPTTLEDKFTYYFRYIDLYMGKFLRLETGKEPSNYDRISRFVDDNLDLFSTDDVGDVNKFKNELNSLRNHYVHEGYYLPNNEFEVKGKREFLYMKKMDYSWLYRVTQSLKLGVYRILYTKILEVDINEDLLKDCDYE